MNLKNQFCIPTIILELYLKPSSSIKTLQWILESGNHMKENVFLFCHFIIYFQSSSTCQVSTSISSIFLSTIFFSVPSFLWTCPKNCLFLILKMNYLSIFTHSSNLHLSFIKILCMDNLLINHITAAFNFGGISLNMISQQSHSL